MPTLTCKITGKNYEDCTCLLCEVVKKSFEVKRSPETPPVCPSNSSELLNAIERAAGEECTCTEEQQTREDCTLCRACQASEFLNRLAESLRHAAEELGI